MIPLNKCEHIRSEVFSHLPKKSSPENVFVFHLGFYLVNVNEAIEKISDMSTFTKNILTGKLYKLLEV